MRTRPGRDAEEDVAGEAGGSDPAGEEAGRSDPAGEEAGGGRVGWGAEEKVTGEVDGGRDIADQEAAAFSLAGAGGSGALRSGGGESGCEGRGAGENGEGYAG